MGVQSIGEIGDLRRWRGEGERDSGRWRGRGEREGYGWVWERERVKYREGWGGIVWEQGF